MSDRTQSCLHLRFEYEPWPWPFAKDRRPEIEQYFDLEVKKNPALWNGRLLLLRKAEVADKAMSGSFFETDYASLLAALDWNAMGDVRAAFPAAAILSLDGAFIVGEMAEYTRNAGQLVFPSGSVEIADVVGGQVDFSGAMAREILEETGIAPETLDPADEWCAVKVGARLPIIKVMRARENAADLKKRISENLMRQERPGFREICAVRGPSDLDERIPLWVRAFLEHVWR